MAAARFRRADELSAHNRELRQADALRDHLVAVVSHFMVTLPLARTAQPPAGGPGNVGGGG
ncbi:hypothetical protein [Planomonospora venezuelensis]|uniref:Light-regulated signal transduction histidine kinase (Bacteriophytochrome) n=1 Tax=Planomonospora venezuelensis TaxID=1999 RepID=A0A841D9S3_PLAVE|nr:hypothetical protein [Planomonospora venezuelensis]MBB5964146.1 light-regulated signal transduction histidine kinase (bacteriophytochrome) [Planomonospora venezuelensis]GIN01830.1 hypothetical protein Pve01_34880 [Planomonospora venezuelensis]